MAIAKWSARALDDIDALAEFIARDSLAHAERVVRELLALGDAAAEYPQAGRVVPEIKNQNIRERFLYSYRLIYQIADGVTVLAVIHGSRLLENQDI